jgi:hypothetical protein
LPSSLTLSDWCVGVYFVFGGAQLRPCRQLGVDLCLATTRKSQQGVASRFWDEPEALGSYAAESKNGRLHPRFAALVTPDRSVPGFKSYEGGSCW